MVNLIGRRFGKLTVMADSGERQGTKKIWMCQCDCGRSVKIRGDSLISGRTTSCGCNKRSQSKVKALNEGKKIEDHTSMVFFKNTISKNSKTKINGVTVLKNGSYRAYIGYKNKIYTLYQGKDLKRAVDARKEADELVLKGEFDEWISKKQRLK